MRTLQEAEDYCNSFIAPQNHPRERTLSRMKTLMNALGNPQNSLTVIHVGGSSGKGSTAYMTATLLEHAGLTVGLHIKPHIQSITERMSINRIPIPDKEFVSYVNTIKPIIRKISQKHKNNTPTYFELLVAIALWYFYDNHVDVAVIEVGRGGRVDATNICSSKLFILTNVSRMHTDILGRTIKEIAKEKMGIVKNTTTVITGATQPAIQSYIKKLCTRTNSSLKITGRDFLLTASPIKPYMNVSSIQTATYKNQDITITDIPLTLHGTFQEGNAALAITAAKTFTTITDKQIRDAFASMQFPGRMEIRYLKGHILIMDNAKTLACIQSLHQLFPYKKLRIVLPAQLQKRTKTFIAHVSPFASEFILVFFPERRESTEDVQEFKKIAHGTRVTSVDISQFQQSYIHKNTHDIFFITGNMTFIGAVRTSIHIPFALK
ncbi:MAG: Mur ligase family protein [Candidatus Gottesmanbacteria bacterium]